MHDRTPIARAKAHFAELVRRAERGETVILTRHGRPVARVAPIAGEEGSRSGAAGTSRAGEAELREAEASYGAAAPPDEVTPESRRELLERFLEESIWPRIPDDQLGTAPSKREREEILGYRVEDS